MRRTKFQQRTFRLVGPQQVDGLLALVRNLPIDADRQIEVVIREEKRKRGVDQNDEAHRGARQGASGGADCSAAT